MAGGTLHFRVLGPVEAVRNGRSLPLGGGKQRALLALLLINANASVSSDRLIDELWAGNPPASAVKSLHVLVSQLRKSLGAAVDDPIATVIGGYQLRVEPTATDADLFERLLSEGRQQLAEGDAPAAERTLGRALALWRGAPFQDVSYESFAREEIARLEERRLLAMEEYYEAMLGAGKHRDAAIPLEHLVQQYPDRERLAGLLMRALYRSGRRAEALAVYDGIRRRLADEFGIEPGEALQRLYASILESTADGTAAMPLDAPATRHVSARTAIAGGALLIVGIAIAVALATRGAAHLTAVPGNALGLIDPRSGQITAEYSVGETPTNVVSNASTAWTINADAQTISRVNLDTGERTEQGLDATPIDLVLGGGHLWVSFAHRTTTGQQFTAGVLKVDPGTLQVARSTRLPGRATVGQSVPLAYDGGALFAGAPSGAVIRIDVTSGTRVTHNGLDPVSLAAAGDTVWVNSSGHRIVPLDATTLRPRGAAITLTTAVGAGPLAVGYGSVWAAEPASGLVWRIDPGPTESAHTIPVGLSASDLATGDGAVWVTSGIDGTVVRIDPRTERASRLPIGNAPQDVAVGKGRVLVTVAGGATVPITAGSSSGLQTLPASSCAPLVYGGEGTPNLLIASDLDLGVSDGASTQPMVQAIEYTLRLHHFRAGRFRVAYQSCDDSTPQAGTWDTGKCQANAKSYAQTPSVVGVIGTFNSGCATFELPILNANPHRSVAMVSPTNDALGLTQSGPGTSPGEPNRYYPSGVRNYARVYPTAALQSRADATLARRLGVQRAFVFLTDHSPPAVTAGYSFATAARADRIKVLGPSAPVPGRDGYGGLVRRLQRRGVDGVFLAGVGQTEGGGDASSRLVRALRRRFGQRLPIIADDGFLPADNQLSVIGPAAAGMYVSGALVLDPARQLPPAGLRFVRQFSATQPQHVANLFTPYAAEATDVLLAAIARSDGSRAAVVKQVFRVRVRNGILGSFHFTPQGDVTVASFPIFRVPDAVSGGDDRPYTVITASP